MLHEEWVGDLVDLGLLDVVNLAVIPCEVLLSVVPLAYKGHHNIELVGKNLKLPAGAPIPIPIG